MGYLKGLGSLIEMERNRKPVAIAIEMNEDFYNRLVLSGDIIKGETVNDDESFTGLFTGLPLYFSDEVETFKIIYDKDEGEF